jgi:hypothetical protein
MSRSLSARDKVRTSGITSASTMGSAPIDKLRLAVIRPGPWSFVLAARQGRALRSLRSQACAQLLHNQMKLDPTRCSTFQAGLQPL